MPTAGDRGTAPPYPDVVFAAEHECVATLHALVLGISLDQPSRELTEDLTEEARHRARSYGATGIYLLVDALHEPPGDEGRENVTRMLANLGGACRGVACVVEGDGFLAAAKRSMMSLMGMATRGAATIRVFGDELEAASWLLARMGGATPPRLAPGHLVAAARELRSQLADDGIPRRRRCMRA